MNNDNQGDATLRELINAAKEKAEGRILDAYFTSSLETSPLVDTFATWLLAVIGATAVLTITNIKSIAAIVPFPNMKVALGFLLVGGLFGFLEKFLALNIRTVLAQESKLKDILRETSAEFRDRIKPYATLADAADIDLDAEVDHAKPLHQFIDAHPRYKRNQLLNELKTENANRIRLRRFYRQLMYTTLEFIGFLMFVLIAALSI